MAQGRATDKYRVKLTADERAALERLVRQGRAAGWKLWRARALLKCDEGAGGPGWADARIAEAYDVTTRSLEHWRKQAVQRGPMSLLERKPQDRSKHRRLDGAGEARLVQLACSTPPKGRGRWSLRLLADQLVALEVVDSIGHECVRQTLQKTR
jgi:Homeodomain-like domain